MKPLLFLLLIPAYLFFALPVSMVHGAFSAARDETADLFAMLGNLLR